MACNPGPDGEIGRRSGLKIRGPERAVGVQVPLRAPWKFRAFGGSAIRKRALSTVRRLAVAATQLISTVSAKLTFRGVQRCRPKCGRRDQVFTHRAGCDQLVREPRSQDLRNFRSRMKIIFDAFGYRIADDIERWGRHGLGNRPRSRGAFGSGLGNRSVNLEMFSGSQWRGRSTHVDFKMRLRGECGPWEENAVAHDLSDGC